MKKILGYMTVALLAFFNSGCADYLDVVPDKTQEITLLFDRKESAYRALSTCYHYIPVYENTYGMLGSSDEMIMVYDRATPGKQVVLGQLTAQYPVMGYWNDDVGGWAALDPSGVSLFKPIRICNTFLEEISRVPDMTPSEISRWASEVKVLKAYYHFLLFTQYGPIPLIKNNLPIDVSESDVMVKRDPVDDVVNYIVGLLDEAYDALPPKVTSANELGRIDRVIATSLKAKVLLYAASPLFNNNPTYASFKDKDGRLLFPTGDKTAEHNKWVKAAEALGKAIDLAKENGADIYKYDGSTPEFDIENLANEPDRLPYMYNYQYMMVQKWNKEVIWGLSRLATDWHEIQRSVNYKKKGETSGDAWQWFNPTMNSTEYFYTDKGLPMDEDPSFDYTGRYNVVTIPTGYEAVAMEGEQTAKMHLNREPRFYASIGFDRSRVRGYGELYDLKVRFNEDNGRQSETDIDNSVSGYFLRKVMHPDTDGKGNIVRYPWPIIRLGELYLSYAEALNEAYGPSQQVYDLLNDIRDRAGVPHVEVAWPNAKLHPDYHKTKEGLRAIIHRERTIELAFEGYRNDDVRRWLEGGQFNEQIWGWNVNGKDAATFYVRTEMKQLLHVFSAPRNYLWPIPTTELVNNTNLVQNLGY